MIESKLDVHFVKMNSKANQARSELESPGYFFYLFFYAVRIELYKRFLSPPARKKEGKKKKKDTE